MGGAAASRVPIMITTGKHVRPPPSPEHSIRPTRAFCAAPSLDCCSEATASGPYPKALIVPHARLCYSGAVAASGYVLLSPFVTRLNALSLLGPSHRVPFYGLAACSADEFSTPLGTIPLESKAIEAWRCVCLKYTCWTKLIKASIAWKYNLPFLQVLLGEFALVPLVVGYCVCRRGGRSPGTSLVRGRNADRRQLGLESLPRLWNGAQHR